MKFFITLFILCSSFIPAFGFIDGKKIYFGNKIQVAYAKDTSSRIVSVNMLFKGVGARIDPIDQEGLGWVAMQAMIEGGAGGLDKQAFDKELSKLGILGGIQVSIGIDNIFLNFECPKENLNKAFEFVKVMITNPTLSIKDIERVKRILPPGANFSNADETFVAGKILRKKVYGNHPYGRLVATFEGMQSINKEDILAALKNRLVQEKLLLVLVGDINESDIPAFLEGTITNLPRKSEQSFAVPEKSIAEFDGAISFIPKDTPQSGIAFAQKGLREIDKDFWSLSILNKIIGDQGFRLWNELREKQGLVYSIGTSLMIQEFDALLAGGFSCAPEKVADSITEVQKIWSQIQENGITETEFQDAKTSIMGSYSRYFTSSASIADLMTNCLSDGFDIDYILKHNEIIGKITVQDVNLIAKKYLTPEKLSFVVVGRPEETLSKFLKERQSDIKTTPVDKN